MDVCFISIIIFDPTYNLLQLMLVSLVEVLLWLSHLTNGFT